MKKNRKAGDTMFTIPSAIQERIRELNKLVNEYPVAIPLPKLAEFLRVDAEGLRSCIQMGHCPFGIGWQKTIKGNKAFKIPTATFYFWYTGDFIRANREALTEV